MKKYNDCMEVREDFSAYLDGEMTAEEREPLEAHLAICAECLREMDVLKRVDDSYRALAPVTAPANFEDGVREAVRTGRMPSGNVRGPVPRWMGPLVAMASAAAVLIVGVGVLEWQKASRPQMQVASAPTVVEMDQPSGELMKLKEAAPAEAAADSAAKSPATWDNFVASKPASEGTIAPKRASSDGDTAWENFAQKSAPAAAAPVSGGREDSGESLGRELAANAPAQSADAESRARAELIGTPPVAEEDKASPEKEKVIDALKDEQSLVERAPAAPPSVSAQPGEVMSRQTLRSFHVLPGPLWVEEGYDHQQATQLKRGSRELRELMKKYPQATWDKLLERTARQIFQMGDDWYDLEAAPAENP